MDIWKLSPIVGEIVDNKVIVIFELYDISSKVSYRIANYTSNIILEPVGPTKVVIEFKQSGIYDIKWIINDVLQYQHQVNLENISKLIFVSCDLLEADTKHSLWTTMLSELDQPVGLVHLGDQAYMDGVFNQCKKLIKDNITNLRQRQCFDLYSQRYCDTCKPHAALLSHVSNYYLWDDHEITNNIQFDISIKKITDVAVEVYKVYQQSCHLNFIINDYCWYKYINDSTVILAIERISRPINLDEIFKAILSLNMDKLILCFSSAPIPTPQGKYGEVYKSLFGLEKFWNQDQLKILYQWLFGWMGSDRQVIVVGGDLHFGVHGQMFKDKLCIPVVIASPITNQPSFDRVLAAKAMKGDHMIGNMTFNTLSSKARRCYATLDIDRMLIKMVYSEEKYPKNKLNYIKTLFSF